MDSIESQTSSGLSVNRREFLEGLSIGAIATTGLANAGALTSGNEVHAAENQPPSNADAIATSTARILVGAPVLQCPAADGMSVVWQVSGNATGWVEYGTTKELGQVVRPGGYGLNSMDSPVLSARLEGLPTAATIYYRVAAAPIDFQNAYKVVRGETEYSEIYEFRLPDPDAKSFRWCVINDTHEVDQTLSATLGKVEERQAELMVWNGDIFNDVRSEKQLVNQTLQPAGRAYATTRPVMFVSGNHDVRGVLARRLEECMLSRPDNSPLGRCFSLRCGPVALIGLDTGEDKPDSHPVYAGLAQFEPYREAQGAWLAKVLTQPEIASAPYLVVHCHIPLFGNRRKDAVEGQIEFARFCEQGQKFWLPHLEKAKAQLVISGHTHKHRFMPAESGQVMAQLIGGSPNLPLATVILGEATSERLQVTALQMDGQTLGTWTFPPRNPA